MRLVWLALVVCACEARLERPGDDPGTDAPGVQPDGPPVTIDAPACSNGRIIYLNFDGQALAQGPSNSKNNTASWMTIANGTAPPYRQADAERATKIQAIVDGVRAHLSSFPIEVVTTRPATGDYVMIVFGGTAANVGSNFSLSVQQLDCNDTNRNDVAWMADTGVGQRAINVAIGAIGFGLGLTATTNVNDCMCGWDNGCQQDFTTPCTPTAGIARDPNANQTCAGAPATQDEIAAFDKAFCQ